MKVDNRFHCFGCQADGDVIDFTARLFGLNVKEAAQKLAGDFSVSYETRGHSPPVKKPVRKKINKKLRLRQAEYRCFHVLAAYLNLLKKWKTEYAPKTFYDEWNPLFVEALKRQTYIEYLLDIMLSGITEEKALLLAEHGKDVIEIEQRIAEFNTEKIGERGGLARTGTDG
jgi:hypothetical protein